MSKGILVLAQNNSVDNYVLQACLLAMSIKLTNPELSVSVVTDNSVPLEYQRFFDKIIPIPFTDSAADSEWKIENRWKLYHASPYDETIVMDVDMLVLKNIDSWWKFLENYEMFFVSKTRTYRNELVTENYYRKTFVSNNLPNLYTGIHYFKKCDFALEFYKWMELVTDNWELFYGKFASNDYPNRCSMDVTAAIVAKILNCDDKIINNNSNLVTFVHMKPRIQNWNSFTESWQAKVPYSIDSNCQLKVGNFLQSDVFHYTEKDFVTEEILNTYRKKFDV